MLKQTARGISMVQTPGQKAFGRLLLESSRDFLNDLGHIALFRAMLERAGVPTDLSIINISDDIPNHEPIYPDVHVPETAMHDDMSDIFNAIASIRIEGHTLGESGARRYGDAGPSVAKPRRKTKHPNKYSDSKFKHVRDRESRDDDGNLM